ncbi:hypothetical protein IV203_038419 [Nitzschia inconspicua]|uniref:Uncharacterized protein n=1 Tax=Nitzschia inconspicua TaxID=303405 RepID=A0A9K3PZH0_9STRA|nr:hypothetical protein IV203_038419 [Nitzschia inconspicua]
MPGFTVYQIDFSAVASGKRVATTKRKIRWRFGFANEKALADGLTGPDCRGEEHDVTIVWSITSGKRQITMDGREIHYSTNRASILDFSWSSKGNHVIKVICHAAPPLQATPGFRQYDLLIDGQSFFTMPKMFQLGIRGNIPNHVPGGYGNPVSPVSMGSSLNREFPVSRDQEEADLRRAIEASIRESQAHLSSRSNDDRSAYTSPNPAPMAESSGDLLDLNGGFGAPPPQESPSVASMPSYYSAPPTYGQSTPTAAAGALVPAVAPPGYYQGAPPPPQPAGFPPTYGSPPPAYGSPPPHAAYQSPPPVPPAPAPTPAQPYGVAPTQYGDAFGLSSPQVEDPFAPKPPPPPSHQDLASAILSSYQSPAPSTPMAGSHMNGYANTPDTYGAPSPMTNGNATSPPSLSMNTLAITVTEEEPLSDFEKALKNLVNVDHIDEPAEGEVKLTMIKKEEAKKTPKGRSVPKPPAGKGLVGENAPLSQIKQNFESPPKTTTEGIMNAPPPGAFHPNSQYAGALVVHGQGPPPLHQASGFGVGRYMPNGGFQNQQELRPGYLMQQQQSTPQYR